MSAAEYLAAKNSDPEHVAAQTRMDLTRAQRAAVINAVSSALREELTVAGYPLDTLDDLLVKYAPLPEPVVDLLMAHVGSIDDTGVQEQIVRALGASASAFDGGGLLRIFEATDSESLRYAIANTFAYGRVRGIGEWLQHAAVKPEYGTARQMLAVAVARHLPANRANDILLELLKVMPGHAALAMAECGTEAELPALAAEYGTTRGWQKKQIGRTIAVIRRRSGLP